jgi:Methyltransferase domain
MTTMTVNDLPTISLDDLLGGIWGVGPQTRIDAAAALIRNPPKMYVDGELPRDQLETLVYVAGVSRPRVVLEIGTYFGYTTWMLAQTLPTAMIHTLDLPQGYDERMDMVRLRKDDHHLIRGSRGQVGREYRERGWAIGNIVQHYGDSATWDWYEAGPVDFVFIDGSHTYEYALNDSEKAWLSILEQGAGRGTIMWHDVADDHPGVVQALHEMRRLDLDIRRIEGKPLGYLKVE